MSVDVTFCFLVTRDLVKEQLWRDWFDRLRALHFKFRVITHVSPAQKANIQSDWLQSTLLPETYLCETEWGWVMKAELKLYSYAVAHTPAAWYTLHSESCVPLVSPETFIETFVRFKNNTFLSYCKAWWTPLPIPKDRANLHLLPPEWHWAHPQWSILCHADLAHILAMALTDPALTKILIAGHAAEESFLGVYLYKINNFRNVVTKATTLVDWSRAVNGGGSPHTFREWAAADQMAVATLCAEKQKNNYLFFRKMAETFPDAVLRAWTGL
jgi:hypothetical protein